MNVYIARHGETDWNREARYQGRRESALTERGILQAQALTRAVKDSVTRDGGRIVRTVSSPLKRCVETIRPLSSACSLRIETEPLLIEIAHGDWEGRLRADIEREDPDTFHAWKHAPAVVHFRGGESVGDVLVRWRSFRALLLEREVNETVVIVTHDVLVRLAILDATGRGINDLWEPRVVNGGYARFAVSDDGRWELETECIDTHLAGIAADPGLQAL